jgi:hypothetical protein
MVDPALALIQMEQTIKAFEKKRAEQEAKAAQEAIAAQISSSGGNTADLTPRITDMLKSFNVADDAVADSGNYAQYDPFRALSMDPFAYADLRYDPVSVDDPDDFMKKIETFDSLNQQIMQSLTDRFTTIITTRTIATRTITHRR